MPRDQIPSLTKIIKQVLKPFLPPVVLSIYHTLLEKVIFKHQSLKKAITVFNSKKPVFILNYRPTYDEDGLFTNHNCDFVDDPLFKTSYDLGFETNSSKNWHLRWRVYIACWLADRASKVDGDFVECGTNKGMLALAIANYTNFRELNKNFYLVDTFSGLVDNLSTETERKRANPSLEYEECYNAVRETFSDFSNVVICRGWVPDILPKVTATKISFLHIDMNSAVPEIAAGEYFWDKLAPAAPILLDDYAYPGFHEQKLAWDAFAEEKGVKVLSIPTGQGLILKP